MSFLWLTQGLAQPKTFEFLRQKSESHSAFQLIFCAECIVVFMGHLQLCNQAISLIVVSRLMVKGLEVKNQSQMNHHVFVAVSGEKRLQNKQSLWMFCFWVVSCIPCMVQFLCFMRKNLYYADADDQQILGGSMSPHPVRCPVKRGKHMYIEL